MFLIDSVIRANPWANKIKCSNGEKNGKLLWQRIVSRILWMSSYPVPGINFRDKPKVILEFPNNITKENQLILEALIN